MSRDELADLVVQWLVARDPHGRPVAFDAGHLGKVERGAVGRPRDHYVAALCAVLNATEAELGLAPTRSVAVAAVDPLAVLAPVTGAASRPGSPITVTAIRAMSHAFQTADRQVGGGVLYGTVLRYLNAEIGPRLLDPSDDPPPGCSPPRRR